MNNLGFASVPFALSLVFSCQSFTQPALAQAKAIAATTPRTAHAANPQQWFAAYDQILRSNLCTAAERQQLEQASAQGVSILIDPQVKANLQNLLSSLITRYNRAQGELAKLPSLPQTEKLHKAYSEYFAMGGQLFADYLKVVQNPLAGDATTGTPLLTQLQPRKVQLANIKDALTKFDSELRAQLGIAPYRS